MQKLSASTFKLALIHTLRGGVFIPIVSGLVVVAVFSLLKMAELPITVYIIAIVSSLSTWFGASYSANFLSKKYFIHDARKIVIASTAVLALLACLGTISAFKANEFPLLTGVRGLVSVILFYLSSQMTLHTEIQSSESFVVTSSDAPSDFPTKKALAYTLFSTLTSIVFIAFGVISLFAGAISSGAQGVVKNLNLIAIILAMLTALFSFYSLSNIWTQYKLNDYKRLLHFIQIPYYFALSLVAVIVLINMMS